MKVMSPIRYVVVAGEASGDILGANLIAHLKILQPNAIFEGIGGPLMEAQGFKTVVPMDRLSVMGLVEVLARLIELLGIRKRLGMASKTHFQHQKIGRLNVGTISV